MANSTDKKSSSRVIMVTGGQRSGKSVFAENLALSLSERPVYIATARIFDEEMRRRVETHRERRRDRWRDVEAPLYPAATELAYGEVVLIDCLTLWATNWFFESGEDGGAALREIKRQIDTLHTRPATFIIVTNEVGLGGVSPNAMQRKFADLQGTLNQYLATLADEVYLVISGIPVKIKPQS